MSRKEYEATLARLEARWKKGKFASPQEIVKIDKQMKEIRKRLVELGA